MSHAGVPVVDASQFLNQSSDNATPPQTVVAQVVAALETWGFFQLINHGVDQDFLSRHLEATKRFFLSTPQHVKQMVERRRDNPLGYYDRELTKQKLDIKQVFDFRVIAHSDLPDDHPANYDPSGVNQWPQGDDDFRQLNEQFAKELARLSFKLLKVIALGLGLQQHALHHLFQPNPSSRLRLNTYPVAQHAAADSFGVSHHKDSGFLTVLLQDEQLPGLQVSVCVFITPLST
eukprot:GHRR01027578.1.p1 GENE.GHRR01027578.1~~GHRR01027578.1.p1  ORF type:complete len:233 (+),score=55.05 GHRR01027578.1:350-1048(+)